MMLSVADVKRNALDDGPGIRTVIFFKGCPLACVWCQNPEMKSPDMEIAFQTETCGQCGACVEICGPGAVDLADPLRIDRARCDLCGACIEACPNHALKLVGTEYAIEGLVELVLRDRTFFRNSGGGVTFSGGEPTRQMDALAALLEAFLREGIHTCLETCGHFDMGLFRERVWPRLDLIYYDLKILDPGEHKRWCSVGNDKILANFEALVDAGTPEVLPRIPLVPGVTDRDENLGALAGYLRSLGVRSVALLPYNPLWPAKARAVGVESAYDCTSWLSDEERERILAIFAGFDVSI